MPLLRKLAAKQKLDEEKRELRLEKRRGYARAGAERARLRKLAESGILDLPIEVAVVVEQALRAAPAPEPAKPVDITTVEELITRLTSIRERLFWLQAVWANTLSDDVYIESEKYCAIFQELHQQLRVQDPSAADRIVAGYEALLLSDRAPARPRLPLAVQQWFELAGELSYRRTVEKSRPDGYVSDGLQAFL